MATPQGARHRDLEQRIRDLEAKVREVTSQALKRKQLSVTQGDFSVSGGGRIISLYPVSGNVAFELGAEEVSGIDRATMNMLTEDGAELFQLYRAEPAPGLGLPDGSSSMLADVGSIHLRSSPVTGAAGYIFIGRDAGPSVSMDYFADGLRLDGDTGGVGVIGGLFADNVTVSPRSTTGLSANVRFDGAGRLLEVTSSERFKQDIQDAPDRAEQVLELTGRTWRDKGPTAADTGPRHVGYIAEELHDAGLTEYVEYDDEGLPHAIAYDRLTVPLVQLAQRQASQIADLTTRLEALEAKV